MSRTCLTGLTWTRKGAIETMRAEEKEIES